MRLRLGGLLLLSLMSAAQADTLTLRITSEDGKIEVFRGRKKLSDPQMEQACAAARAHKTEIAFDREKMSRDDALAAILKEAQCLGAHGGATKNVPEPKPKSAAHTHARPRHKAKARR